ncbi:DUF4349 domain-containing protein [Parerythrobacter jejuensis]|uniref:DUF4349 domain-containing protein n=1 Tax=Parerythrobacter jejuensis TaxID=795812 RepID=A0A845AT88_9SPHN|nr:DUF4349 domain-containing protein [Parerythrobacter jejuensis]MXP31726.1 DUF4349 domain-containing protein [Parerythrobacter jejuensis]
MMRKKMIALLASVSLVAACSQGAEQTSYEAIEADSAMAEAPAVERAVAVDIAEESGEATTSSVPSSSIPVSAPQIAYVYDYGYRVAPDQISTLAQRHVDLCEKKGPQTCRVISLQQSGSEGSYAYGKLELAVAAGVARDFGKELSAAAESVDGEQVNVAISGEDLSKRIVDTEARLRARSLLRDRLMEVLRSRRGTVAELVEAERGVAQVNEEIDQARSWLTEMRGRVAFSRVSIDYNSSARTGGSFSRPIVEAFQSMGSIMGATIGFLIYLVAGGIPVILALLGLRWLWRRSGMTLFGRKSGQAAGAEAKPAAEES